MHRREGREGTKSGRGEAREGKERGRSIERRRGVIEEYEGR
jgi:hypothetical protein